MICETICIQTQITNSPLKNGLILAQVKLSFAYFLGKIVTIFNTCVLNGSFTTVWIY